MRGKNRLRRAARGILAVLLLVFLSAPLCFADLYNDYDTKEYNVKAKISQDHVIHVEETIKVDFNQSQHHGITRYIPVESQVYTIRNIKTPGYYSDVETESGYNDGTSYNYKNIRIGDPDNYLEGVHTFKVIYDIVGFRDDTKDADYLALDLLPSEWNTPIEAATLVLTMPEAIDWKQVQIYSGAYGSESGLSKSFNTRVSEDNKTLTIIGTQIPDFAGVTVRSTLPEGYWVDPENHDYARTVLYVLLAMIPAAAGILWFLFGRDPQVVKTVEFYPPENLTPAEVGYIYDDLLEDSDMSSMIMYFADKGYLSIQEREKDKFTITKTGEIDEKEKAFAKDMFHALFLNGKTLELDSIPQNVGKKINSAKKKLLRLYSGEKKQLFTDAGALCRFVGGVLCMLPMWATVALAGYEAFDSEAFYIPIMVMIPMIAGLWLIFNAFDGMRRRNPVLTMILFGIGIVLVTLSVAVNAFIALEYVPSRLMIGLALGSQIITILFTIFMKSRTQRGARLYGQVLGFRQFIRDAEYDRLKLLSDQDPAYFFNIMPYAFVMGLSVRWAKKFKDLDIVQPDWLDTWDRGGYYSPIWYSSMFHHYSGDLSKGIAKYAPKDTGSRGGGSSGGLGGGGFSGGGFSGGGFGGGGGGAW